MTRYRPHPMSLRQLQYALAVADTRSFRRAAELCHVSQPSLSAQLAQLESALDVRLFERDRRRVLLTPAGEELLVRARRVLLDADDLLEAARQFGDPLAGTLRLGVIPTISPYLVPEVVPALRLHHAQLTVLWVEDKTEVLVRALQAGHLDAALLALEAHIGDLEYDVIARDPFVLATAPGHPLTHARTAASIDALHGTSVLLLDDGHCFRDQVLTVCSEAETQELAFRATSLATLAQMVAGGVGVTLLPRLAVPTENRRNELAIRRFSEPQPYRTIVLAWRRKSPLAVPLRQVAGTMRDAVQRLEPQLDRAVAGRAVRATRPRKARRR